MIKNKYLDSIFNYSYNILALRLSKFLLKVLKITKLNYQCAKRNKFRLRLRDDACRPLQTA